MTTPFQTYRVPALCPCGREHTVTSLSPAGDTPTPRRCDECTAKANARLDGKRTVHTGTVSRRNGETTEQERQDTKPLERPRRPYADD